MQVAGVFRTLALDRHPNGLHRRVGFVIVMWPTRRLRNERVEHLCFAFAGVRVTRRRTTKQMLLDGVQSPVSGLRIWVPTVSVAVDSWVGEALLWTLDALIDCVRAERWEKRGSRGSKAYSNCTLV